MNMDTTVTTCPETKTNKLLRQLDEQYEVIKQSDGIYHIHGMLFLIQFLVISEMSEERHVSLTSLTRVQHLINLRYQPLLCWRL